MWSPTCDSLLLLFLSHRIYANPQAFNDVTQGKNTGAQNDKNADGFTAITGWDAASGVGTPNWPAMVKAL